MTKKTKMWLARIALIAIVILFVYVVVYAVASDDPNVWFAQIVALLMLPIVCFGIMASVASMRRRAKESEEALRRWEEAMGEEEDLPGTPEEAAGEEPPPVGTQEEGEAVDRNTADMVR
ncbi:MAG: hypothetical protein IJR00_10875 [Lachnospiraceae bacterium]|nr:hypothetical protein [Lachnospiraceae bacterium]